MATSRRWLASFLLVLSLLPFPSARGEDSPELLGVQPAEAMPAPDEPKQTLLELRRELEWAKERVKASRERLKRLEEQMPSYGPGGFWVKHAEKEIKVYEGYLANCERNLANASTVWRGFVRLMNTDLISGQVVGGSDLEKAQKDLAGAKKNLEKKKAEPAKLAETYKWYQNEIEKEKNKTLPALEAEVKKLEAKVAAAEKANPDE